MCVGLTVGSCRNDDDQLQLRYDHHFITSVTTGVGRCVGFSANFHFVVPKQVTVVPIFIVLSCYEGGKTGLYPLGW